MKKLLLFAFAVLLYVIAYSQTSNTWTQKNDLGFSSTTILPERSGAVGFSIGQKGYIGTGKNSVGKKNDFWEYSPSSNTWTQKANFPGSARSEATGFSLNGKGYIGTGIDVNGRTNDFYEYNPATNSWAAKASFPGTPRDGSTGFSIGNKGYIGTGLDAAGFKSDFWEFDPATNLWIQKAIFPGSPRSSATGFVLNGLGYLGTGTIGTAGGTTNTFYAYNPVTNTWTQKANIGSIGRALSSSFSLGSKAYLIAGRNGTGGKLGDFWEYNPSANAWNQLTSFNNYGSPNREGGTCFSIGNNGYYATGLDANNKFRNDIWQFDVNNLPAWKQKANLGDAGRTQAVAFSIGHKGYIGTGYNGTCKKDFWEFDPATNTWSQKADYKGEARKSGVGFTIGNKGYLGLGEDDLNYFKNDFYEYDPSSNSWKAIASYPGSWSGGGPLDAISFTIGRKGYIISRNGNIYDYSQATNTWSFKGYFPAFVREEATGFSIGNKGYIGTGTKSSTFSKDFWEYDPSTNTVTQKTDFPGNPRTEALGFSTGTKGYLGCGRDNVYTNNDLYEYNPATNSWTQRSNVPGTLRLGAVLFSIGSKGYKSTGLDNSSNFTRDLWEYTSLDSYRDIAILTMSGPLPSRCGLTNQESITVTVSNIGTITETSVPLGYSINGVQATTTPEIFTGTLSPNSGGSYTFTAPANLSLPGIYTIRVYSLLNGDNNTSNDTAEFKIINYKFSSLPFLDFETPSSDISRLRQITYLNSDIGQGGGGSNPPYSSTKNGLLLSGHDDTTWVSPTNGANPWTMNTSHFSGVYLCFNPAGGSSTDSLWLKFDLNQLYKTNPANTSFRITVNGTQVGSTYNPQSSSSFFNWNQFKVNLYQYRNLSTVEIGFESNVNESFNSGLGDANLLDNIRIVRRLGATTGIKKNLNPENIKVFPNPGNGKYTVYLPAGKNYELQITDLTGKIISKQSASEGFNKIELPTNSVGVYILKITSESGSLIKKLILE